MRPSRDGYVRRLACCARVIGSEVYRYATTGRVLFNGEDQIYASRLFFSGSRSQRMGICKHLVATALAANRPWGKEGRLVEQGFQSAFRQILENLAAGCVEGLARWVAACRARYLVLKNGASYLCRGTIRRCLLNQRSYHRSGHRTHDYVDTARCGGGQGIKRVLDRCGF